MLEALLVSVVIFTLATFLGVELINRVPTMLHTPLMSGANAISGITAVGAIVVAWLPERFRGFSSRRYFVFGVVLVLMMVFRPQGIIPRRGAATGIPGKKEEGATA